MTGCRYQHEKISPNFYRLVSGNIYNDFRLGLVFVHDRGVVLYAFCPLSQSAGMYRCTLESLADGRNAHAIGQPLGIWS